MTRIKIACLLALIVAVPAAAAGSLFGSGPHIFGARAKPCVIAGNAGYEMSASAAADYIVRVDNNAASADLRLQLVDDPAAADFVLVDDGDAPAACQAARAINSVRLAAAAANADLTVALSRANASYKIYVRSAYFSEQDAAALFAAILQSARRAGGREFAVRD